MRRFIRTDCLTILVALIGLTVAGCRPPESVPVETIEEEAEELASMIYVADPRASLQLVKGFHGVEQNAWRWTAGQFAVTLRPPAGAADNGAVLHLKFSVPDPIIEKLQSITLSASAAEVALEPETYAKPGEYVYTREVSAAVLGGDAVTVDFSLDKSLKPGEVDQRELGVVVSSVGFEAK